MDDLCFDYLQSSELIKSRPLNSSTMRDGTIQGEQYDGAD